MQGGVPHPWVGSAHHARSDGVLVSVPTVAPQGLAIMLADAATQTEKSEDEASPRLIRSKSLPPMYYLDWPYVLDALWESSLMHLTSQVYADLRHRIRGCWGCNPLMQRAYYKDIWPIIIWK
ncbi:hypothetical protein Tco_1408482 [Tanacetum coccineum]